MLFTRKYSHLEIGNIGPVRTQTVCGLSCPALAALASSRSANHTLMTDWRVTPSLLASLSKGIHHPGGEVNIDAPLRLQHTFGF